MKKKYLFSDYVKDEVEKKKTIWSSMESYASYLGISRTVLYDMLNGKYNAPSPLTATRMCEWFGLEPDTLFDMLKNVDEKYIEDFSKQYYGEGFENACKSAIKQFFQFNNNDELYDEEPYEGSMIVSGNYTFTDLKFANTQESSIYDGHSYNATGYYSHFSIESVPDGDADMIVDSGFTQNVEEYSYDFVLYYLPPRRMRKASEKTYPDEEFRDFTTKLFNIIRDPNAPENNLFLTSSRKLYDSILRYTRDLDIKCTNGAGVGLIYFQLKRPTDYANIIENEEMIQGDIFD